MKFDIRPYRSADMSGVAALHREVAWPVRSAAGWRWLESNPARDMTGEGSPVGWVVDGPAGPAAFVGQFVQPFWMDGQAMAGITGFSIIVPPAARGASKALIRRLMDQPSTPVQYTLNANARSARLYGRYGLHPWPAPTHGLKLSWVVDPAVCAVSRCLRGLAAPGADHDDAGPERLMNPRLAADWRDARLPSGVEPLDDLSDRGPMGDFWADLKATKGRLVADRSPATLRWRMSDPDLTRPPVLLVYRRDGAVAGWAMAIMGKNNRIEPPILDIIDLTTHDDDAGMVRALVHGLLAIARRLGAAKMRLQVVSPELLEVLGPLAHRARREGGWGHGHARFDPAIFGGRAPDWRPTPFDGDYSFCLRPPPVEPAPAFAFPVMQQAHA